MGTIINPKKVRLIVIDSFCGAGGVTQGFHNASIDGEQCVAVVIGINHDAKAIASHKANHPETVHFTEDFRSVNIYSLIPILEEAKKKYPHAKVMFHMSAECTHHSIAKGGMSRDADSRSLPEYAYKYIQILQPDIISIENVKEFLDWGPLEIKVVKDKKGNELYCPLDKKERPETESELKDRKAKKLRKFKRYDYLPVWTPIKSRKKEYYNTWRDTIKDFGYHYDYKLLNAADFGAYTSRIRYFGLFAKNKNHIVFPKPTHSKDGKNGLEKWKAVKDVLDFSDEGESVFSKQYCEATLKRIESGLIKFVAGGKKNFLVKYNSMQQNGSYKAPGTDEPCPVVTTQNRLGVCFISKAFSGHPESKNISVDGPAGSVTTVDHHQFITAYYGNGFNTSVNVPANTVTTKDRFSLVQPQFMDQQYGCSKPTSILQPLGALTTNPKYNLISCKWLMDTGFHNVGTSLDAPSPVITANRKYHYLMDAQYDRIGRDVDKPCFTLIARMDKMPPYLVQISSGSQDMPSFIHKVGDTLIYEIYDTDTPMTKQIKEFMAMYGIVDIKMRMLKIIELLLIMGFPADYILIGTQADQKKFIGNAVECTQSQVFAEALSVAIDNLLELAA